MRMLGNSRFNIEYIMDMTGLSKEEIEQLDGERTLEAKTLENPLKLSDELQKISSTLQSNSIQSR
jgi:hypothetical protein